MPSTRSVNFLPDDPSRELPPASMELRAPADVYDRADRRARREHPGRIGRPRNEDADEVVETTFAVLRQELTEREAAIRLGAGTDGRRTRALIEKAKDKLAERLDFYLDAHAVATQQAAVEGDAKPAQWAIENISIEGERPIDPPTKTVAPTTAPTFNIGFALGGIPQPVRLLPPAK